MINLYPTKCNLCSGKVIYTSNADIYGKEYGSGKCYRCLDCGAYVGTHISRPREAFGILADANMRKGKMMCHDIFDGIWKSVRKKKQDKRRKLYQWLAKELGINEQDCHFGYFDIHMLRKAYAILKHYKPPVPPKPCEHLTKKQFNEALRDCLSDTCYYCSSYTKHICNELKNVGIILGSCGGYKKLTAEQRDKLKLIINPDIK